MIKLELFPNLFFYSNIYFYCKLPYSSKREVLKVLETNMVMYTELKLLTDSITMWPTELKNLLDIFKKSLNKKCTTPKNK